MKRGLRPLVQDLLDEVWELREGPPEALVDALAPLLDDMARAALDSLYPGALQQAESPTH